MSWTTLVVGSFSFKSGVPEALKQKIIEELEDVLEAKLKWDEEDKEYKVEDINWSSHVSEEEIEKVYNKWMPFFKLFSVSLYYLTQADYNEYNEDDDQDFNEILDTLFDGLIEDLESGKSEQADYKLRNIIELLKLARVDEKEITEKVNKLSNVLESKKTKVNVPLLKEFVDVLESNKIPTAEIKRILFVKAL